MFFVEAELCGGDVGHDFIAIGFFTTVERAADGARAWLVQGRAGGEEADICLIAWCGNPDNPSDMHRCDLASDDASRELTRLFRGIEREHPVTDGVG